MPEKEEIDLLRNLNNSDILSAFVAHLRKNHNLEDNEIYSLFNLDQTRIPISIFSNDKLSTLETVVKYLKENVALKLVDIATLLNRDQRAIWTTYNNSKKKFPFLFSFLYLMFVSGF